MTHELRAAIATCLELLEEQGSWVQHLEEPDASRVRKQRDGLAVLVAHAERTDELVAAAVADERAAVADYLRRIDEYAFLELAKYIERGEHRRIT